MDKSIREILYTKGLYDDVINIIQDYSKLTLKEQCLDKKSLKRFAKHQRWLENQNYNKRIDDKICKLRKELCDYKNLINYYNEFIFVKDLTQPPRKKNGHYITIYPTRRLFTHPLTKEEIINIDLIIPNIEQEVSDKQSDIISWMFSKR